MNAARGARPISAIPSGRIIPPVSSAFGRRERRGLAAGVASIHDPQVGTLETDIPPRPFEKPAQPPDRTRLPGTELRPQNQAEAIWFTLAGFRHGSRTLILSSTRFLRDWSLTASCFSRSTS
jgi:hypothetical protein